MTRTIKAIRLTRAGGPEVLEVQTLDLAEPGAGEALVRHTAVAVNFVDIQHRQGLYPLPVPGGVGLEAAGVVEQIGQDVSNVKVGDRVIYFSHEPGAYAEARIVPAQTLIKLPEAISERVAASCFTRGVLAWYLVNRTAPIGGDDTILVHAAAGGVGSLIAQFAKAKGARVIGVVGSEAKVAFAQSSGCDVVLLADDPDLVRKVREASGGEGVSVVFDSIGQATWVQSLSSLKVRGLMVSFGDASGRVTGVVPVEDLGQRGSLQLIWMQLRHLTVSERREAAIGLFTALADGTIKDWPVRSYPLIDAARAHADLESRATTGASVLEP